MRIQKVMLGVAVVLVVVGVVYGAYSGSAAKQESMMPAAVPETKDQLKAWGLKEASPGVYVSDDQKP